MFGQFKAPHPIQFYPILSCFASYISAYGYFLPLVWLLAPVSALWLVLHWGPHRIFAQWVCAGCVTIPHPGFCSSRSPLCGCRATKRWERPSILLDDLGWVNSIFFLRQRFDTLLPSASLRDYPFFEGYLGTHFHAVGKNTDETSFESIDINLSRRAVPTSFDRFQGGDTTPD